MCNEQIYVFLELSCTRLVDDPLSLILVMVNDVITVIPSLDRLHPGPDLPRYSHPPRSFLCTAILPESASDVQQIAAGDHIGADMVTIRLSDITLSHRPTYESMVELESCSRAREQENGTSSWRSDDLAFVEPDCPGLDMERRPYT